MKKVLLTTTALAFAGSAFAADVSGWMVAAHEKSGEEKSLFTYTDVYVSGSKTASNGLTFGADYTMSLNGAAKSTADSYTAGTKTTGEKYIGTAGSFTEGTKAGHEVNGYVSSSFGTVNIGHHNAASKTHGAKATHVGNGPAWNDTDWVNGTYGKNSNGVTYVSPSFNGVSAAYSMKPGKDQGSSFGVMYSGSMSGVNLSAAYGSKKSAGANAKTNTDYGVSVAKGAFSASYSKATNKDDADDDGVGASKNTRMGVAYSAGKISVGYSQNTVKPNDGSTKQKHTLYSASYQVASGLTAFFEQYKNGASKKTTLIGTTVSF